MPLFDRSFTESAPVKHDTTHRTGLFGTRRSPSREVTTTTSHHIGGFLNRHRDDRSILQARERVSIAETKERDATRALNEARVAVRQAKEEVRRLEIEADDEARRAKAKQQEVHSISKRVKPLGRY